MLALRRLIYVWAMLLDPSVVFAGAWLQPKGDGLLITQATYYSTDTYFDTQGRAQSQPTYRKYEFQPYAEYGVTDWLTVGSSAYLQSVAQSGGSNRGIADPQLFAKLRIWDDKTQTIALQPLVKFRSIFSSENAPRGGSRSTDAELSLLYGRNMPLITPRDYVDVRVGYRTRNRGLSDQILSDAVVGIKCTDAFEIAPAVRSVMATKPTDVAAYSENGDMDYHVIKAEVTAIYHLDSAQWLQAGLFKHVAGMQTGDGYGITLGYAQRF
jgi:hypothetical protein